MRPRFSMLTIVLLMAIVALSLALWTRHRELVPLRSEVRKLRNEVGPLSIEDESKFHAVRAPSHDEYTWRWRIWIPAGQKYRVTYVGEKIPASGLSTPRVNATLSESGEHVVEYRIRPDVRSGVWSDLLRAGNVGVGSSQQEWVSWKQKTSTTAGVGESTQNFEPGEPIVLARHRVSQTANDSGSIEDPSAGFLIWLELIP
jgi:hypothetical protein